MSYILDALRRAESERERGSVPTLHSRPLAADETTDEASPRRRGPALWPGLAALPVLAFLAWWLWPAAQRQQAEPPPSPVTSAPAPTPMVVAAAPAPIAAQVPSAALVRVDPLPAPIATPAPVAPAPAASAPAEPQRPLPLVSELPAALRSELPALQAGGAMVAEPATNSMLIINGQLYREGEQIAPQLVLEQIRLRGAVLSFKGQRFRISY